MNFTMDVAGQFSVLLTLSIVGLLLNMSVTLLRKRPLFRNPARRQAGMKPDRL